MGAPLAPVPNVARVVLEGFVDASQATTIWANVLHFRWSGSPPSNADCAALGARIATQWGTNVAPLCPSPTQLQVVSVTDLTSPTAGGAEALVLVPGTRGDDSIPANAAVLISYPSALRYKGGHPRTYLYAGGNADLQFADSWQAGFANLCKTNWDAFLTAVGSFSQAATSFTGFCTIRYRGKFLPNGGPPHYYLNTPLVNAVPNGSSVTHQQMASQRGRIGRRKA